MTPLPSAPTPLPRAPTPLPRAPTPPDGGPAAGGWAGDPTTGPVLGIDTALSACAVALDGRPGLGLPLACSRAMDRGQAEALVPMIADLLTAADLTPPDLALIAVTIGPGGFTGLRVGLATARGLALAIGCPVIGIGVGEALADPLLADPLLEDFPPSPARDPDAAPAPPPLAAPIILTVIDSRRGDCAVQAFAGRDAFGLPVPLAPPAALDDSATQSRINALTAAQVVGDGAARLGNRPIAPDRDQPDPLRVARLGRRAWADPGRRAAPVLPLYLRPADATPAPRGGCLWP